VRGVGRFFGSTRWFLVELRDQPYEWRTNADPTPGARVASFLPPTRGTEFLFWTARGDTVSLELEVGVWWSFDLSMWPVRESSEWIGRFTWLTDFIYGDAEFMLNAGRVSCPD
jgi:hypothetical protein